MRTGKKTIDFEEAKKILGWSTTMPDGSPVTAANQSFSYKTKVAKMKKVKDGDGNESEEPVLDEQGNLTFKSVINRVRFEKNQNNRKLSTADIKRYTESKLAGRWKLNGQPICIDSEGQISTGAHRLIAICCAEIQRLEAGGTLGVWNEPVEFEYVVVTGLDPTVADTIDTGRSRNANDMVGRTNAFDGCKIGGKDGTPVTESEKKKLNAILSVALRLVWLYSHGRQVSTAAKMLDHHVSGMLNQYGQGLVNSCLFIYEENGGMEKKIQSYLTLGYAAGVHYMMANSQADNAEENADEFWTLFANEAHAREFTEDEFKNPETGKIDSKKRNAAYAVDPVGGLRAKYRQLNAGTSKGRDAIVRLVFYCWQQFIAEEVLEKGAKGLGSKDLVCIGGLHPSEPIDFD
tara:strand:- start:5499 stop:6710 length:1212 start_codon:yes stop_codon:yes gene_type:complete